MQNGVNWSPQFQNPTSKLGARQGKQRWNEFSTLSEDLKGFGDLSMQTKDLKLCGGGCSHPLEDQTAHDAVCRAFTQLYDENPSDFPVECRDAPYLDRLRRAYPIHPELFDRLYDDWSPLENFQKTRGVLRLMAAVIHHLWINEDRAPLILPGSIPLDSPRVPRGTSSLSTGELERSCG